jgi:phosphatidylserine/phosphatidylglycerophosphate/cardiolipin synthase-like enzyme
VCTADKPDTDDDTQYLQADFRSSKVRISQAKKPYMHAKVAIFDGDIAYVGSSNFTTNALDNNREVGILWAVSSVHRDILMGVYRGDCEKV